MARNYGTPGVRLNPFFIREVMQADISEQLPIRNLS